MTELARDTERPLEQSRSTRRGLFRHVGSGLCTAALMQLFHTEMYGRESTAGREILDTAPRKTAHPASAKGVVHLFMNGGRFSGTGTSASEVLELELCSIASLL